MGAPATPPTPTRPPRRRRSGGLSPAWLAPSLLGAALGCAGAPRAPTIPQPIVLSHDVRLIAPAFVPQFGALEAALEDGEDEVAHQILNRLLLSDPRDETLEMARAFGRILDGRDLARSVRLRLASAHTEEQSRFVLVLLASHGREQPITLRLPPGDLEHLLTGIDATGVETKEFETHLSSALSELEIPPHETVRIDLLDYVIPLGRALAVREQWRLELRPGELVYDGRSLPAARFATEPCERTRLATFLPTGPVEPAELIRYMQRDVVNTPPLLERAVRIETWRREEALAEITPVVERLAVENPRQIAKAAAALRWLARTNKPGIDAKAWALYLRARLDRRLQAREQTNLDL